MLKKAVLSGYPVKVNKKKAVVRWMFHNREDIQWFRPVDLWTKHGRRGQIKVCKGTLLITAVLCSPVTLLCLWSCGLFICQAS